ncbi:hypothetical protein [Catellatospora tritici]|uniref:hypothetical protein n=1 Tax=Catellatospora tritici TaxID=2851566 RepID=UPI001C2DA2A6|nr:hypothetical protein [Catellatospora tritici]MBV1856743.1 hypothetical protein [Catellatospora tritici]
MRRTLSAFAAFATAVAVAALAPGTAHAASAPDVLWAYSVEGDFGRVQVGVSAEAGVADLKVHVVGETGEDLAVLDSFTLESGSDQYSVWRSDDTVALDELGYYRLDAEIVDRDGVHVTEQQVGLLIYAVQMYYDNLKVTKKVDYAHREVTVTGRLMGRWPTGRREAIEGFPLEYVPMYGDYVDGVSDNAGQFRLTTQVENVDDMGYLTTLWVQDRPYYLQAFADVAAPEIKQAATRITLDLDRTRVVSGETVTVSGTLSWKPPHAGWRPTPNALVVLVGGCDEDYCQSLLGYTLTDAQGHYSMTVTPPYTMTVQVGTHHEDPFVTTATTARADLVVLQAVRFGELRQGIDWDGRPILYGHLDFQSGWTPGTIPVEVQYSPDGRGWHTVGTLDLSYNPHESEGIRFEWPLAGTEPGYWRAVYAGTPDFFQSAVTEPLHVA